MGTTETKLSDKEKEDREINNFLSDNLYEYKRNYPRQIIFLNELYLELKEGIDILEIQRRKCDVLEWREYLEELIRKDNKRISETVKRLSKTREYNRNNKAVNKLLSEEKDKHRKPIYQIKMEQKNLDKRRNKIIERPPMRRNR